MPAEKQIANPGGAYGLTADPSAQVVVDMINGSGGTLVEGDVVICADVNGVQATTTTTVSDGGVIGVVGSGAGASGAGPGAIGSSLAAASNTATFASLAIMPVVVAGPARVNIAANTVAAKGVLTAAAAAKTGAVVAAAVGQIGGVFATALESQAAKDANNTIRCWIKMG